MEDRRRLRLEQQATGGWVLEVVDHNLRPPVVVPGSRKFVDTSQIAGLFADNFSTNTGVFDQPSGLAAMAISPSRGIYLHVEPAKVRPVVLMDREDKNTQTLMIWTPPSAWIFTSDHDRNQGWQDTVKMAMIIPSDLGMISADSRVSQYPMSNTYGHFGICWGSVAPPKLEFPRQMRRAVNLFFESGFNGHVWHWGNFTAHVKEMGSKKVLEMTDPERMELLRSKGMVATNGQTLAAMWKTYSGGNNG